MCQRRWWMPRLNMLAKNDTKFQWIFPFNKWFYWSIKRIEEFRGELSETWYISACGKRKSKWQILNTPGKRSRGLQWGKSVFSHQVCNPRFLGQVGANTYRTQACGGVVSREQPTAARQIWAEVPLCKKGNTVNNPGENLEADDRYRDSTTVKSSCMSKGWAPLQMKEAGWQPGVIQCYRVMM